jgi:hypothetical protein
MSYDPDHAPDAAAWLDLDPAERRRLAAVAHEGVSDALHARGASGMHVSMHAACETMIAEGHVEVAAAIDRLLEQGVRRHAALHMVIDVLARRLVASAAGGFDEDAFTAQLRALDAASWISGKMQGDFGFRPDEGSKG